MTRRIAVALVMSMATLGLSAGPAFAHPGHDHKVLGTVTMAAADHVMLKDKDGKDVTVQVNAATKVVRAKKAMTMGDVKTGMRVVITAVTEKEQLVAKTIELAAAPAATK